MIRQPQPLDPASVHKDLAETLTLLRTRPRTLTLDCIAKDNEVSTEWLTKLMAGKIKEPGFNKVAQLRDYLRKESAE